MKLMKAFVALLVVAGLAVPAVAIAEDRLSLGGEMRVRGWYRDYDTSKTDSYADQRLRIGGKIAIAEGVSITFRTDITESVWGSGNTFGSGRIGLQQWDRAHIDLASGNYHLRAGQQYIAFGKTYAVDTQDNGLSFDVVGDMPIKAFLLVDNDGGSLPNSDGLIYGVSISPKSDNMKAQLFVAGQKEAFNVGEEVYVIGGNVALELGAINLAGELDFFTGDANAAQDAMGTQAMIDASMAASDAATIGGQIFYAQGADSNEVQYQSIGNQFGGWDPIYNVGTKLSNEQISLGKPFDWTGAGAGCVGARLYGNFKVSDAVKAAASLAYLEVEEDSIVDGEATALAAGLTYAVMPNTSLQAQVQLTNLDFAGSPDTDNVEAGVGLFVTF